MFVYHFTGKKNGNQAIMGISTEVTDKMEIAD